ncbi:MAG TPA: thioredoxin-like domain-containing protein [Longimicrobiales bacterium]|nr:thioredoxin-like domain-containing protein [Longimicrobiales bacterium]
MRSAGVRGHALARSSVGILLCCLSASCGSDITGAGSLDDLPGGASPSLSDLFGNVLLTSDGSQAGLVELQGQSLIGIYFASRSCPACTAFTPELVGVYDEIRRSGKAFEIVLAAVDPSSEDLSTYMKQHRMGWLALPLGSEKVTQLAKRYDVEWIPTIIVINVAGRTITKTGREDVLAKGAAAFDKWLAARPAP